jgi:hypothetical protein
MFFFVFKLNFVVDILAFFDLATFGQFFKKIAKFFSHNLGGAAFHQSGFSLNAQFHLVFKTVSRISVALLLRKLLII